MTRMRPSSPRIHAFEAAIADAVNTTDARAALELLRRAHVLGQCDFGRHLRVHVAMLRIAWATGDSREVVGQLWRLLLVPLGHLTGRLPKGNPGTSDVSAFAPRPIDPGLARLLEDT